MKALLEFDLNNNDDVSEFEVMREASKYQSALWDIDQWLRNEIKYKHDLSDDVHDAYQKIREKIYEKLDELEIKSWM